jgi:hypothetical protein
MQEAHESVAAEARPLTHNRGPALRIMPSMQTVLITRGVDNRLFNTESRAYVSLSELADMLVNGQRIEVRDAKTGENVTSETLDLLHRLAASRSPIG